MQQKPKLFVSEHEYYFTPTDYYVNYRIGLAKLDGKNLHIAKEMARFYYHKMIMNKEFVDEKFEDKTVLDEQTLAWVEGKEGFYETLWNKKVPGLSPLDKAINTLIIIKKNQKKAGNDKAPEDLNGDDMNEIFTGIPSEELFESTTMNELFENRKDINDFARRIDILQRVSMIEAFGKSFEIKKAVTEKRVQNSIEHKQKRMVEYGELPNVALHQRLLPSFNAKLITKDLVVNTPIESQESKQKIIVLLDVSGSMHEQRKQDWVLAILADRLSYCMKEECEIFFSYFLTVNDLLKGNFKFTHIHNRETALNFFKYINTSPSGGGTEVGPIIEEIRKEILDNHKLFNLNIDLSQEQPEILVINDGNDRIMTETLTWKTNAITLYEDNKDFEKLCKRTDGKYVHINSVMD